MSLLKNFVRKPHNSISNLEEDNISNLDKIRKSGIIGIVAGNGDFPLCIIKKAKELGIKTISAGIEGEADEKVISHSDVSCKVKLGQVGKSLRFFVQHEVQYLIIAGGVSWPKPIVELGLDVRGARFLSSQLTRKDDHLMRGLAKEAMKDGITMVSSDVLVPKLRVPEGVFSKGRLSKLQKRDINIGLEAIRELGKLHIGQTVVVSHGVIIAVEAVEGTDEAILRGGQFSLGDGVVVKASKPEQDMRFDIPTIGLQTIESMKKAGCFTLAVEAGKVIMLDKDRLISNANESGIILVGVK